MALVVVAAIGVAALLLQLRLRPNLSPSLRSSSRGPLWLNAFGVPFRYRRHFSRAVFHLSASLMLMAALLAVVAFAISGIVVLNALRKPRT